MSVLYVVFGEINNPVLIQWQRKVCDKPFEISESPARIGHESWAVRPHAGTLASELLFLLPGPVLSVAIVAFFIIFFNVRLSD